MTRIWRTGGTLPCVLLAAVMAAPAPGQPAPAPDRAGVAQAMEQALRDGAPGVLVAAHGPSGPWWTARGVADPATGRAPGLGDRFRVGSVTKVFTAAVVLQLVHERKVRLADPVHRWLPGLVRGNGHDGHRVTLRQLLNHTSGIPGYDAPPLYTDFDRYRYRTYRPEQLVRGALRKPPTAPPGTRYAYSNTNYLLLGLVIERATGHSRDAEVTRRIIRPLGLRETRLPAASPKLPSPQLRGHELLDYAKPLRDVTEYNPSFAGAAGDMVSTVGDLRRFLVALATGRVVEPAQLAEMTTPWRDSGYGLGIARAKLSCGVEVLWHNGAILGYHALAATTLDGRHTLAYGTNTMVGRVEGFQLIQRLQNRVLSSEFCGRSRSSAATPALPGRL